MRRAIALGTVAALAAVTLPAASASASTSARTCRFELRDEQIQIRYDRLGGRAVLGCPVSDAQETFEPPGRRQSFDYGQIAFSHVGGRMRVLSVSYIRHQRKIRFMFGNAFEGGRFSMRIWGNGVPRIPRTFTTSSAKPVETYDLRDPYSGRTYRFDVRADVCGAQPGCPTGTYREPWAWAEWRYSIKIDNG
ncbi:hypothetical protein ACFXJ8_09195 [Nonomuraea sp. NPDC059194]|uniref:hypothetical protein n=1 Tax=Nonomuraea sp. NPDC059194 TaxID=3346764 RepID=UPI00369B8C92